MATDPDITSSETAVDNRRLEHRFPAKAQVEISIVYPVAPGRVIGFVVDISKSGMRLRTETSLPKGSRVQVKMGDVVVFGEVRHCREADDAWFEAGIQIEDMVSRTARHNT